MLFDQVDVGSFSRVEELANRLLGYQILARHFHVLHHKCNVARVSALLLAKVDRLKLLVLFFQEGVSLLEDAHVFLMGLLRTSGVDFFEFGYSDFRFAFCAICQESSSTNLIVTVFGRSGRLNNLLRGVAVQDLLHLCRPEGVQATTGARLLNLISTRGRRLQKQVLMRHLRGSTSFVEGAR